MERKVGIVGVGRIGSRCAYTIANQGLAREIILYDIDQKRVMSEMSDLRDGLCLYPHRITINAGEYKDLSTCDIIAITAGVQTNVQDRRAPLEDNAQIVERVVSVIMKEGFQGIFIIITNPCDVLAYYTEKISALGRERVFATGTFLDTIRLKKELSLSVQMSAAEFHAYVMGEHGDSQLIPWSLVTMFGEPLYKLELKNQKYMINKTDIETKVRMGAWNAVEGKGVAEYGVASCFARCVRSIFYDEKQILPLSTKIQGEYGADHVCFGTPAVLGAGGIETVIQVALQPNEYSNLMKSYEILRACITKIE